MHRAIDRLLNTGLGAEKTIETDIHDYYMEGRDVIHGVVDHKTIRNFEKKKPSKFDDLVRVVDRIPELNKMLLGYLKATKIFNFDEPICYGMDKIMSDPTDHAEQALADFYGVSLNEERLGLPFPNTCIVTPDSATMLNEVRDERLGEQHSKAYMYTTRVDMHGLDQVAGMQWFCSGLIVVPKDIKIIDEMRVANKYFYIKRDNGKFKPHINPNKHKFDGGLIAPILGKVLSLIMTLNTPDRFIMEVSPVNPGVKSDKFIPRSHQRSEYIMLHPHVIRHYMKTESDVEGHKMRGHERRAHLRRYPDDKIRFPKAHGKTIQIAAVWIGRTEATVGERHYKVIL